MTEITSRLSTALADRYRIERHLGEGGMATVYLAEDLKHKRKVALKVLKPELAAVLGAERFVQEITTTASLQHPHILPLFDSGEADSFLYYVMPFIDGETLRDKLNRETQLSIDEAVDITTAIADALDAAHQQGVIHRDIKPENILLHNGRPMVADFGIALAVSAAAGGRMTETGLSLGTPHYMSPEQATAEKDLTARSDVYSLASVLYEMLTGSPPHVGSSAQQIIMKIVTDTARPITELRKSVPPNVAAAVGTALEKLPADRFTTAAQFAAALSDTSYALPTGNTIARAQEAPRWNRVAVATTAIAVLATAVAIWGVTRPDPELRVARFIVGFNEDEGLWYTGTANPSRISITPDGSQFVYMAEGGIRARVFDQLGSRPLSGTEGGFAPVIAPDGDGVAFMVDNGNHTGIKVASLAGGPPISVLDSGVFSYLTWGSDGSIYFVDESNRMLRRVPGSGGTPEDVLPLDLGERYAYYDSPFLTRDGSFLILTAIPEDQNAEPEVHVVDRASGSSVAAVTGSYGVVSRTGHLVYVTPDGTLMAALLESRGTIASPTALAEGVGVRNDETVDLALSDAGTLMYVTFNIQAPEDWVWVTADGGVSRVDPNWTEDLEFEALALSPDDRRLAVEMSKDGRNDIWVKQLDTGPLQRLTFEGMRNARPEWSPDGRSVGFISIDEQGARDVWVRRSDGSGSPQKVLDLERNVQEFLWSSDATWLVAVLDPPQSFDIVAIHDTDSTPVPLLTSTFHELQPALSPDDRWLAYSSDLTGRWEVYIRPFPNVQDGRWQISTSGGREPRWSADGSELYVRHLGGNGMDVFDMTHGPSAPEHRTLFEFSDETYFELNSDNHMYDVARDGRVLMLRAAQGDISGDLIIVQNFFEELKEKVGN